MRLDRIEGCKPPWDSRIATTKSNGCVVDAQLTEMARDDAGPISWGWRRSSPIVVGIKSTSCTKAIIKARGKDNRLARGSFRFLSVHPSS
jgi:hypothetical protein